MGKLESRPDFDRMLAYMREGETLVVWRLDRLGLLRGLRSGPSIRAVPTAGQAHPNVRVTRAGSSGVEGFRSDRKGEEKWVGNDG